MHHYNIDGEKNMCRLALKNSIRPLFTLQRSAGHGMEAMQEGYDGSGLGLLMRGIQFADYCYRSNEPILSGIAHTKDALDRVNHLCSLTQVNMLMS